MRGVLVFIWEIIQIVVIALLIVLPIRYFVFQPFFVRGQSMVPTFEGGDYLIVDEISYRFRDPQRGEVIVFKYPQNPSLRYIKRIIGLPGETIHIENNQVIISNKKEKQILNESSYLPSHLSTLGETKITLTEDEYFVLGDNRVASSDSRRWGGVPRENIIGRVFFRLWPVTALAQFEVPEY